MRILVFSDVHGNLPAFEFMLKNVGQCDSYICLGDLVNYGPWSNECVDLALSLHSCKFIMGNHEEAFIEGFYPGNNDLVKLFFDTCYPDFIRINEIKKFEKSYSDFDFFFTHTIEQKTIYPDTAILLNSNYVIGHSHHQFVFRNNGFTLYNAGSVGQNREYINVINYLILETTNAKFELCNLVYDADLIIQKMIGLKYPRQCVKYYSEKKRLHV